MADIIAGHSNPSECVVAIVPTIISVSQAPAIVPSTSSTPSAILNPFDPRQLLPDNQHDPLYLVAPQTWAQLNPNLGTQNQRLRAKPMDAAKAVKKITAARNKANAQLLSADIDKYIQLQKAEIEKIAHNHSWKPSDIEKLINHHTNYRHSCAPSLINALTHKKGVEMNEGMFHHHVHLRLAHRFTCRQRSWRQGISYRNSTGKK
jgi:hypothetical protein